MFLDGLFDSFGKETISDDDYVRNYDDVGERNNETDRLAFDRCSDAIDDNSYSIKLEQDQCIVVSV